MNFEVFGNVVKHCLSVWYIFLIRTKLRRKWRINSVKIYANEDQVAKYCHGHDVVVQTLWIINESETLLSFISLHLL